MAIFDNVSSIVINEKEVASIKIGEGVLFEKGGDTPVTSGTVTLTLLNESTPMQNVTVVLMEGETSVATGQTGNDGVATIENVPNSTYDISINNVVEGSVTVNGDVSKEIVFRNVPFTITENGTPVQGVVVQFENGNNGTTGSAGGCTVNGVSDGNHTVKLIRTSPDWVKEIPASIHEDVSFTIDIAEL